MKLNLMESNQFRELELKRGQNISIWNLFCQQKKKERNKRVDSLSPLDSFT